MPSGEPPLKDDLERLLRHLGPRSCRDNSPQRVAGPATIAQDKFLYTLFLGSAFVFGRASGLRFFPIHSSHSSYIAFTRYYLRYYYFFYHLIIIFYSNLSGH